MFDTGRRNELYRFEVDEYGVIFDRPRPPGVWLMGHPGLIGGIVPRKACLLSDVRLANSKTVFVEIDEYGRPVPVDGPAPAELVGLGGKRLPLNVRRPLRTALLHAQCRRQRPGTCGARRGVALSHPKT